MVQLKQGFKGQRLITISPEILGTIDYNPLTNSLYATKIGYFPAVKYHYVNKANGVDYYILIYCVSGKGWYKIGEKKQLVKENEYIILPPNTPYSFGASNSNPWTIYWIHFKGNLASSFLEYPLLPREIKATQNSRIQDRIHIFEEIYENLELSFHSEHYSYASMCLFYFLSSFKYINQFRQIRKKDINEFLFSEKVIYYMKENLGHNLTLNDFAEYFGYSSSHFSSKFLIETKQSPIKYFIVLKVQKACEYIELSNMKLCDIYPKLGFQDAAYFSRIFTKIMGISPSKYREREKHLI